MKIVKPSDLSAISVIVSDALEVGGKSWYVTQLSKNKAIIAYELAYCPSDEASTFILGGSRAEGTALSGSDSDGMRVLPNVTLCTQREDATYIEGHVFLMDSRKCRPGFTRLVPFKIKDDKSFFAGIVKNTKGLFLSENDGVTYMLSQRFCEAFVSYHETTIGDIPIHYRHGPCATVAHSFLHDYNLYKVESDMAYALKICTWPSEADEWISRERHYSWPLRETINKIRQHDCHAVAVGDPESECSTLEWRVSFLLGERELVWSFNDTQIQCYYLLKYFLKTYLDKLAPGQLSSYHMKTLMFWQCEESDPVIWNRVSLLSCVKTCLEKLREYIERKELQHYFDRKRNLLHSKFENVEEKDRVLGEIEVLLKDIVSPVMQSITWKSISNAWKAAGNMETFFTVANLRDMASIKEQVDHINLYNMFQATITLLAQANPDLQFLLQGLERYTLDRTLDWTFVYLVKYFVHIRLGIELSKRAQITRDLFEKQDLLKEAQTHLEIGSCMDSMSAILYLATFNFSNGKFSATSSLIENMLQNLIEGKHFYAGVMSKQGGIQIDAIGYAKRSDYSFSEDDDLMQSVAYDIIFSPGDISVLPYVIQFECILLKGRSVNVCVYHPFVYSFFLLCLSKRQEGQYFESVKALLSLERAIEDFVSYVPKHRSLNLLGYCYFSIGEYARAFRSYKRSLEDFPNVRNAAAYHIIILALNMMDNQILYVREGNVD